ncbi:transforming growth factor beta activator LRRC32-like [Rhinoraja longicauda]
MNLPTALLLVALTGVAATFRPRDHSPCRAIEAEALCRNKSLDAVPEGLPRDIWKLDLSVNRIQNLWPESLARYKSVQHLDLESNRLEFIQPGSFALLPRLEVLNLAHNLLDQGRGGLGHLPHLKSLELSRNTLYTGAVEEFLRDAPSLERVSLARNSITKLSGATFRGSPSLTHLNLAHNIIMEIEAGAFGPLANLSVLDLATNSIPCITGFDLRQLRVLNLSRNSMEAFLVEETGEEFRLEWLDLSDNNLPSFPAFPARNRLRHLDLSRNSIRGLSPDHPGSERAHGENRTRAALPAHLPDLVYLDLSYNEITSVPWESLRGMRSLRVLNLSSNCLGGFVMDRPHALDSLVELDLSSNSLQDLFLHGRGFRRLRYLYLQDNHLHRLPCDIFSGLPSIQTLRLQNNDLSVCRGLGNHSEDGCMFFSGIATLRYLYLHNNNIRHLPPHAFRQTPLVELDLSMNSGIDIHPEGLGGLEVPLTRLSLGGNGLSSLSIDLSRFANLRTLDLSRNRLSEFLVTAGNLSLENVDLRDNALGFLEERSMEVLNGTLRTMRLSGNPFNCCRAAWVRWLAQVEVVDRWSVLCHYPVLSGHSPAYLFSARPALCQGAPRDQRPTWAVLVLILGSGLLGFATVLGCCLARRQRVNKMTLHHVKA